MKMNYDNRKGKGSLYPSDSFNEAYFGELKSLEAELSKLLLYGLDGDLSSYHRATEMFRVDKIREFFEDKPVSDFPMDRLTNYIREQIIYMKQHSYLEEDDGLLTHSAYTNCMSAVLYLLGETDELIEYVPDMNGFVERFTRFLSKPGVQRISTPKTGDFVVWSGGTSNTLPDYLPAGWKEGEYTFSCVVDHTGVVVIDEENPWKIGTSEKNVIREWYGDDFLTEKIPELQKMYILEESREPARLTVSPLSEAEISSWKRFDFYLFRKMDANSESNETWVSKLFPELPDEIKKKYDEMVKNYQKS